MTEDTQIEVTKKKKEKKKLSDFEIVKTIFLKTTEYRLPYILKNTGEDSDIYFLCSSKESDIIYGSSEVSIAILEITDSELKNITDSVLRNLKGFDIQDKQIFINIKEQMSEYGKDKEEGFKCEIFENEFGSSWILKKDVSGNERIIPFVKSVEDLFHLRNVEFWNKKYRHLLDTQDPNYEYYPFSSDEKQKISLLTLGSPKNGLNNLYSDGFRSRMTKGVDLLVDSFVNKLDYPILKNEIIVFRHTHNDSLEKACQLIHRIQTNSWRMIILRPNFVIFPKTSKDIGMKRI